MYSEHSAVIAIMRGQLAIPLSYREEAIAEGYELDALRAQLVAERMASEESLQFLPSTQWQHFWLREEKEKKRKKRKRQNQNHY